MNESASFSCLNIGMRPLFRVFQLLKFWITVPPEIFKQTLGDNKKGPLNKCTTRKGY